jgi:histidine ammonia-lyase
MMVLINGNSLALDEIINVARYGESVELDRSARDRVLTSWGWVEEISRHTEPVYGINTGFGIFSDKRISPADCAKLSRNLILSHSVATGDALSNEAVKAAMLVRANTLAKGYSGVRPAIIELICAMLNRDVVPVVPQQGSMGSSGDLGPLSHLALVLTTDEHDREEDSGFAWYQNQLMTGKQAMLRAGLNRIILGPKEGLALNNGATFSAAIGALCVHDAMHLMEIANMSVAMTLEALEGCSNAFDERIHQARGQAGQIKVAQEVRRLTEGSNLIDAAGRVQDAYSLRCVPQVHGAVWETMLFVKSILEREVNAATDNPLLFERGVALSGGNFHGEPVGLVMDYLSIAIAELGAISERRIFRLTDGKLNGGLPNMLVDSDRAAGLNSGLMMPQYTAASLVLENQTLATPDSVHSLPTSGEQEDHNANSMTAARHAYQILKNVRKILAIELYTSARAMDLRLRQSPELSMSRPVQNVYDLIRSRIPYQADDRCWGQEIDQVEGLINSGDILRTMS